MIIAKGAIETFEFTGAKAFSQTLGASAVTDLTGNYEKPAVRLACSAHGYLAGGLVRIDSTTNYDGLRKIIAVATNTFDIYAKYVAETPAGTETARVAVSLDEDYLFLGFELHLSAASATTENLVATVDAAKGSAFDTKLYSKDMNTIQDIVYYPECSIHQKANDLIVFTWSNSNSRTWGLSVKLQRMR